ncbi:WxL domain-containing protein [Weissella confusa]|uniref:WxL domain-containing protein n=1 Tax=Weissella confusa TaxID=1583 RepID=A0A4Z0RX55_WEICO|nr:WxL domain-containing protein [Weissella confusa]TGE73945.1 hypothetical protein C6P11_03890 [Weissella confusa]
MKKTVFLATAAILTGMVASSAVFADTATYKPVDTTYSTADAKGNSNATTDAWVTFKAATTNPDKPLNPGGNPDNPSDKPSNGGNTNPGLLALMYAPQLDFGDNNTVSAKEQTFGAIDPQTAKVAPYAQVSDHRSTGDGWSLHVKENGQFMKDGVALKGATLNFVTENKVDAALNTMSNFTGTAVGATVLDTDAQVMSAPKNTLDGIYYAQFGKTAGDKGVTLTVPGNAALAGNYHTTLTWTLNAAPDDAPAK